MTRKKGKMRWWKKMLLILLCIPAALALALLLLAMVSKSAPNRYTQTVAAGGSIEAKYLQVGPHKVKTIKVAADDRLKQHQAYYPADMEDGDRKYPVILSLNGTGVAASKSPAVFRHFASWGFIVVGNEASSTGFGDTADRMMEFLLEKSEDESSVLCGKVDFDNIGLIGHSQGGAGVFSALTISKHVGSYKTVVALSPTHEEIAHQLGWLYVLEQVDVPVAMFAGTETDFETQAVIPVEKMEAMFEKMPSTTKVMARRRGADHGQMLYSVNGYAVAWFRWQLMGDVAAAKAFAGKGAELLTNPLYQDQRTIIPGNP